MCGQFQRVCFSVCKQTRSSAVSWVSAMTVSSAILEHEVEQVLSRSYPSKGDGDGQNTTQPTLPDLLRWLSTPPMVTTLRVNTTTTTTQAALHLLGKHLQECVERGIPQFRMEVHHRLPDCLLVFSTGPHLPHLQADMEVMVDCACGAAVLRGADIFKQGILGAPQGMQPGSRVRVMADLDGKCLRGFTQTYQGRKLYIGTGTALVSREEVFCADASTLRGVGIRMNEALYQAPSLSDILPGVVFAQNLPSIVCGHVLDPQPGQVVLDMCAAPGGKTCHLATLMKNKGRIVALDKTADKVSRVKNNADVMGLTCIETYAFDARKAVKENAESSGGPPYPPSTFDAILLDGPCSALGQRPCVRNKMSAPSLASFPKLQRMLLSAAVALLRPGGVLVYSTCTVTLEENEDQVAWLLHTCPALLLEPQKPHLGGHGLSHGPLTEGQCQMVQRFDPGGLTRGAEKSCDTDTIGFFIAKFRKKSG
ncbi:tRNA (cytosine(72)-C(5))-methyltransferase NSUN6-like isoform X2 [Babylonia areolata]|uniref:tRNA (cytosine(72)-C(5))-methyltransferase NSUN6-like isoform X2 n=1 Tax=Babylonia areolata TaxID=304850 RepID=UPI003FD0F9F4